jgi:methylmalonyl-CoA/ethylmalonyl-CoA epimerase
MIKKIDHIGIAVRDINEQINYYRNVLGLEVEGEETVPDQGIKTCFIKVGDIHIELLQPVTEDSPVKKFIDKKGEGIHHISYLSTDINETVSDMKDNGIDLLNEIPKKGAGDKMICFAHPKSTFGVLTEICQESKKP